VKTGGSQDEIEKQSNGTTDGNGDVIHIRRDDDVSISLNTKLSTVSTYTGNQDGCPVL
jgi:hypothetical protein